MSELKPAQSGRIDNGAQFKKILKESGLSQERVARLISDYNNRALSARSIRAWIADPSVGTYRPCPDWALNSLKKVLEEN